ncbi:MAG: TolC family protein [Chitinophagaceae bacterium]
MKQYLSLAFVLVFVSTAYSQTTDSLLQAASLQNCVQYALTHQPLVQQSLLDEEITEKQIRIKLADWYPQLNFNANYQHNFQIQTSIIGGNAVQLGVHNTSLGQFALTQTIFNRDVLLANRTADDVRKQAKQTTTSNKIDIAVNVSKAFYDVLLTQQQIALDDDALSRLEKSFKNAFDQYQGGIVDKIDYKRATISLNNARAQKKQDLENLSARYANLRNAMGYPVDKPLDLIYDSAQLERDALVDTTAGVNYDSRIEYQLLQTQKRLQNSNLTYYKWGYLPSVSAFGTYNANYLNDNFGKLYGNNFPNSFAGIQLAFPIFQGGKRIQQIRQASLQVKRVDYDIISLKNNISAAYTQALATYKSAFVYYNILKDNLVIATDVYNTIQLQYKEGVKTYLDVIFAESDLRTAQVNYANALYQVLSSKLDVQKQMGTIQY